MAQEFTIDITEPVAEPMILLQKAEGIFGSRMMGVITQPLTVRFILAAPFSSNDGIICQNLVAGSLDIDMTATPPSPSSGDAVVIAVTSITGAYTWRWSLNGVVVDGDDEDGSDMELGYGTIESGTHLIEVWQGDRYGFVKLEVS